MYCLLYRFEVFTICVGIAVSTTEAKTYVHVGITCSSKTEEFIVAYPSRFIFEFTIYRINK